MVFYSLYEAHNILYYSIGFSMRDWEQSAANCIKRTKHCILLSPLCSVQEKQYDYEPI